MDPLSKPLVNAMLDARSDEKDENLYSCLTAMGNLGGSGSRESVPKHTRGTCEWLLKEPHFQEWMDGTFCFGRIFISFGTAFCSLERLAIHISWRESPLCTALCSHIMSCDSCFIQEAISGCFPTLKIGLTTCVFDERILMFGFLLPIHVSRPIFH